MRGAGRSRPAIAPAGRDGPSISLAIKNAPGLDPGASRLRDLEAIYFELFAVELPESVIVPLETALSTASA